jgi:hypothetical protein
MGLGLHAMVTVGLTFVEQPWVEMVGLNMLVFIYGVPFVLVFWVLYEILKLRRSFIGDAAYFYLLGVTPYLLAVLWIGSQQVGWEQWGLVFFALTGLVLSWLVGGVVLVSLRVYQRVSSPHTKIPR